MTIYNQSQHRVVAVRTLSGSLFELVLERDGLEFMPGDCVALQTERGLSRPYSMASGVGEKELRFLIRKLDGGEVSPWLAAREEGDVVTLSAPFGWFRPGQDQGNAPFVFLATGTGIAPFLSSLRSLYVAPLACFYGVRETAEAVGRSFIESRSPLRLAVSREVNTAHHYGRITDLIAPADFPDETHYYLCGHEGMINEVSSRLLQAGVPLKQLHREVFFHG